MLCFAIAVSGIVNLISGRFQIGMVCVCFAAARTSPRVRIMHVCRVSIF